MPFSASCARCVVATETLSNTASTATPASRSRSYKGTPSFSKGLGQLGIHFRPALPRLLRRGVVADVLIVNGRIIAARPRRLRHLQPAPVGLQAPFRHPFRLVLLFGRWRAPRLRSSPLGSSSVASSVTNPNWYSCTSLLSVSSLCVVTSVIGITNFRLPIEERSQTNTSWPNCSRIQS
jgi:hypothetical protein